MASSRSTHDVPDLPAPAWNAAVEIEAGEQLVPSRIDRSVTPLVGGEAKTGVADDENRIEGEEPHHPRAWPIDGDGEKPVVAAGPEPRDGSHGVAAEPVGDEPLPLRGLRRDLRADRARR